MTFEVFALTVFSAVGLFVLARVYVVRSIRSLRAAEPTLTKINEQLEKLIKEDVPVGAARVAFMLATTAGCGCYVRGVIFSHYLPPAVFRFFFGARQAKPAVEHDLFELDKLNEAQRHMFSDLITSVIIYDGFRNPLSGWIFRHVIRKGHRPTFTERGDTELTTVTVLSRAKPKVVPARPGDLCAA